MVGFLVGSRLGISTGLFISFPTPLLFHTVFFSTSCTFKWILLIKKSNYFDDFDLCRYIFVTFIRQFFYFIIFTLVFSLFLFFIIVSLIIFLFLSSIYIFQCVSESKGSANFFPIKKEHRKSQPIESFSSLAVFGWLMK